MEKKIYNQMGFDFGDGDPEQESPAAGFRIKSMKPASRADAGEQDQEKDIRDEIQSGVNGQEAPAQDTASTGNSGFAQNGMVFELDPEKQKTEDDPNNDSEVIPNIPVTTEAAAHATAQAPAEGAIQENHQAENPAVLNTTASAPEAEVAKVFTPNIPSRLTRPTQVYAVEENEDRPVAKNEITADNTGFTPASSKPAVSGPGNAAEELPVQAAQPVEENNPAPVEYNTAVITQTEPPAEKPTTVDIPVTGEASTVAEPVQQYQADPPKQSFPQEEPQDIYEDENYNPIVNDPGETFAEPELPKKSTRGRKSLKTLDAEAGSVAIPDDSTLFKRQYYSIGEVAGMFAVNQSLLRFWENEFDIIQPRKNRKGDRHFRPVDIKNLELIYDLLRRRKLTIEGAKEFLKKNKQARERFEMIQSLQQIKGFLLEIKASL